jgi:hypothetical protein
MSYTTITRIDDQPPIMQYNLDVKAAYQAAMRPEMKVGPNRWHVMMYYHAKTQLEGLAPGQCIDIAWQDPSPNPEEEVVRISIMRQALRGDRQDQPQYDDQPNDKDQDKDQHDRPAQKRNRMH